MRTIEVPVTPAVAVAKAPPSGSMYAELLREIKDSGLLERRSRYYVVKIVVTALLLGLGWVAFFLIGDSWWQLMVAAYLAFVFTQIGFIGHDAGHKQIARSRQVNDTIGLIHADLAVGLSFGWWVDKHNRHHAHPNQEGKDPDINTGFLAFVPDRTERHGAFARWRYRHQALLFFPVLTLEALHLHVASIRALLGRRAMPTRVREIVLFGAHLSATWLWFSWCFHPSRQLPSSSCSRGCSACTSAAPSPRTTRAWRSSAPSTTWTSCAARC
jgi:fatty acid desaturase